MIQTNNGNALKDSSLTHICIEPIGRLFRHQHQVSVDAFLHQVLAPLPALPRLQVKTSEQTVLGCLGNVHSPVEHTKLLK